MKESEIRASYTEYFTMCESQKEMTKTQQRCGLFFHRIISPQNLECIKLCLGVDDE